LITPQPRILNSLDDRLAIVGSRQASSYRKQRQQLEGG